MLQFEYNDDLRGLYSSFELYAVEANQSDDYQFDSSQIWNNFKNANGTKLLYLT